MKKILALFYEGPGFGRILQHLPDQTQGNDLYSSPAYSFVCLSVCLSLHNVILRHFFPHPQKQYLKFWN
jgi:hypothetical protein